MILNTVGRPILELSEIQLKQLDLVLLDFHNRKEIVPDGVLLNFINTNEIKMSIRTLKRKYVSSFINRHNLTSG